MFLDDFCVSFAVFSKTRSRDMSYREIITLQVGHYSNYVGAHWWNIQESSFQYDPAKASGPKEVCHDVLFREGLTLQNQVTFTPRLLAFDLKGSLRSLKRDGVLYETGGQEEGEIQWLGDITMHEEEPAPRNPFLEGLEWDDNTRTDCKEEEEEEKDEGDDRAEEIDGVSKKKRVEEVACSSNSPSSTGEKTAHNLDDSVTVWSDFLRTHFHPRSIHVVEDYYHGDENHSFNLFSCGSEVLGSSDLSSQWEDSLHFYSEECDNLQGFHVLADTHDGFGGVTEGLVSYLADEFPGKGVLTFGFTPSNLPDNTAKARATRIINSALAYSRVCDYSSLFVPASLARGVWPRLEAPVSMPDLRYQSVPYHTSAILAASLDTLSLPYRQETSSVNLRDITHSFNAQGRTVASLSTSMPMGLQHRESIVDFFCKNGESFPWQSLTPNMKTSNIPIMQSVVMRGISNDLVKTQTDIRKLPDHMRGLRTRTEVLDNYLAQKCAGTLYAVSCHDSPLKTAIPFPHIFKEDVNKYGFLYGMPRPSDVGVESIPQMTSLQCGKDVGGVIKELHTAAARLNIKKHHRYIELGLEEDDYTTVLDNLETLSGKYYFESEGL